MRRSEPRSGFNAPTSRDGPSSDPSDEGKRSTRKRVKPEFFDPTPQPSGRRGRGRPPGSGRKQKSILLSQQEMEVGEDSWHSVAPTTSLLNEANFDIPTSIQSEENLEQPLTEDQLPKQSFGMPLTEDQLTKQSFGMPLTEYQLPKQSFGMNTSACTIQQLEQYASMKKSPQDASSNGQATFQSCSAHPQHFQETTNSISLQKVGANPSASEILNERQVTPALKFLDVNAGGCQAGGVTTTELGFCAVNPSLIPTFQAILNKHGDIAKDCPLQSNYMRTSLLEAVCKIIQDLQGKELHELNNSCLYAYFSAVQDAQTLKLNVNWLSQRLGELYEAMESIAKAEYLSNIMKERTEVIEVMKKDLQLNKIAAKELNAEIEAKERQLVFAIVEAQNINVQISSLTSKFIHFQRNSLTDGLL